MIYPVEFALAISNSFPSGTGSYSYKGQFAIVVQNLAYEKQVSIWAQVGSVWKDIYASYVGPLPENRELWIAPASNGEGEFAAKYEVNGAMYWDNNSGTNYKFPQAFDEFAALTGKNYKVILGNAGLTAATLEVDLGIQNLAYEKVVGVVYTTDNWASTQTAYGNYVWTMKSGLQVWHVSAATGGATEVKFALFYQVLGSEYWDNNFWRNYTVTPSSSQSWGIAA